MDNTVKTNKNMYVAGLGAAMVSFGILKSVEFSFLIAGHTKVVFMEILV